MPVKVGGWVGGWVELGFIEAVLVLQTDLHDVHGGEHHDACVDFFG